MKRQLLSLIMPGLCCLAILSEPRFADGGEEVLAFAPLDESQNDFFGISVGIDGTLCVIGASGEDDLGTDSGSAYLFDSVSGQQRLKLLPGDGAAGDLFGCSVAISGSIVVVGAYKNDGKGMDAGAAYLFDATSGQQIAKLTANDASAVDYFGRSVAISGSAVIVGAFLDDDKGIDSGSAYLFDALTGQQTAKLVPSDGATIDWFGRQVGISGSVAIVGSRKDDDNGTNSGSAYLFDTATGAEVAKLIAADGDGNDTFGISVAVDGQIAVVGANGDFDNGGQSGSVYLFDVGTGGQIAKLLPNDGDKNDFFGSAVAIRGTTLVVGAPNNDDKGVDTGSAYVFDTSTLKEVGKFLPSMSDPCDFFGDALGISGTTVLSGVHRHDFDCSDSGIAFVFDTTNVGLLASTQFRNGSGINASILSATTNPVLGANWELDLDASGHAPAIAGFEVRTSPFGGSFFSGGELLVDPTSPLVASGIQVHFGGVVRFSISIPGDPSICGMGSSVQGIVFGGPGYEFSNALDLVLGN